MSKIPQGEWNVIAARYQKGESISNIARSYGCTPPAIHYILKRNRQQPMETKAPQTPARQPEATQPQLLRMHTRDPAPAAEAPANKFHNGAASPTLGRASSPDPAPSLRQLAEKPAQSATAPAHPGPRPLTETPAQPRPSPMPGLPGLDSDLHLRAETAIELFRSSFDAAMAEGSPIVRERLRQAASDLMRVAARTTIVLDRLNAIAERSARAHNYPRSAHTPSER